MEMEKLGKLCTLSMPLPLPLAVAAAAWIHFWGLHNGAIIIIILRVHAVSRSNSKPHVWVRNKCFTRQGTPSQGDRKRWVMYFCYCCWCCCFWGFSFLCNFMDFSENSDEAVMLCLRTQILVAGGAEQNRIWDQRKQQSAVQKYPFSFYVLRAGESVIRKVTGHGLYFGCYVHHTAALFWVLLVRWCR